MPLVDGRTPSPKGSAITDHSHAQQPDIQQPSTDIGPTPIRSRKSPKTTARSSDAYSILRNSKTWSSVFFKNRVTYDRLFVDTVKQKGPGVDLLAAFLRDSDASGPSWEVEQARKFCLESPEVPDAKIWFDDRMSSDQIKKQAPNWMTSAEYRRMLPSRMSRTVDHDVRIRTCIHRRLTFVPNLTSNVVNALMETSSWCEVQTLRSAVRQHIAGGTSISVFIPTSGFPFFRISMHLPYLLLKPSLDNRMENESGKKLWNDLSFLPLTVGAGKTTGRYSIYEAQTTVDISGAHHYDWHGYAFGNPGPKDAHQEEYGKERDNASDAGEDDDDDGDVDFFEEEEDVFATGGCEPVTNPGNVIWDPRVYFLCTLQVRLVVVVQANEYLVQHLQAGVKLWQIQEKEKETCGSENNCEARDQRLQRSLKGIKNMTELFQLLRELFSKANTVWENFNGERGDIRYFADLKDSSARSALHKIEECFENMKKLELTLARLQHTCEQSAANLALQLSHEGHEMSRKMTISHEHVIALTKSTVESALRSQKAAEDTSRATRVNVQLLTVTTAVVIALQYFCSDQDLFPFKRSARAFWISVSILVPGLLVLTFALNTLDQLKEVFTRRFTGKSREADSPA